MSTSITMSAIIPNLTAAEQGICRSAINRFGTGSGPIADERSLPAFVVKYVRHILNKHADSASEPGHVRAIIAKMDAVETGRACETCGDTESIDVAPAGSGEEDLQPCPTCCADDTCAECGMDAISDCVCDDAEGETAEGVAKQLMEMMDDALTEHFDGVRSFEEIGPLSRNAGFELTVGNRTFLITVVRSR